MQINEMSLDQMKGAIRSKLNPRPELVAEAVSSPEYRSIEEVFSDYCIIRASGKMYKQGYKVGKNDTVELVGQPVEVQEKTTYEPVKANDVDKALKSKETNTNNKKGGPIMDRTEQVKALIALGAGWAEGDVELLTSLDDAAFSKVTELATAEAAAKSETQKTLTVQAEKVKALETEVTTLKANADKKPATAEEYVAAAPAEIAEVLRAGVAMHQSRKTELVTALKANARCKFSEDELKAKGLKELEVLAELAALPSYAGVSGGQKVNTAKAEDNKMPEIDFSKKA